MKRKLLIFAAVFFALCAQAKNKTIVVKGARPAIGETEIIVEKSGPTDTLTVVPARDASVITVNLKTLSGNVIQQYTLAATCEDIVDIISPELPEGYFLEVRDDNGVIYTDFEN